MSDLKNRTTTLERILDAPIELVFEFCFQIMPLFYQT
jgi:uncharacterized protein YndB with AHSA1/START domain